MSSFEGSVAIVTGSARGIGAAIAGELRARGAGVLGVDVLPHKGLDTTVVGDLREEATVERCFAEAGELPGTLRVLVNSAFWEERGLLLETSQEGWEQTLAVSLGCTWRMIRAFAPRAGADAAIVNLASVHSFGAVAGFAPYEAAKAAIVALTRSAAVELGPRGIRCNAVAPGFVAVERNRAIWEDESKLQAVLRAYPLGRPGRPEDVAKCVAFLASSESAFVTGSVLRVDGGMSAQLAEAMVR